MSGLVCYEVWFNAVVNHIMNNKVTGIMIGQGAGCGITWWAHYWGSAFLWMQMYGKSAQCSNSISSAIQYKVVNGYMI